MSSVTSVDCHDSFVDGVRVLHFPGDSGVSDVSLIFGVGLRDESLPTCGALHALEHLVMDSVRRTPLDINATVDHTLTTFTATGSAGLVRDYLAGICCAVGDPPVDRLAAEAKVLAAEEGDHGLGTALGSARFGFRDLGLVGGRGPGPAGVTEQAVRALTGWFVASNAVLIIDGVFPEDLRLPLSQTPSPAHGYLSPVRWPGPHALTVDDPACGLSVLLPPADAVERVARAVLTERFAEVLRHHHGLTYDINDELFPLPGDWWELFLGAAPVPEHAVAAVATMIDTVQDLLRNGPTDSEFHHARALVVEATLGRDAVINSRADAAIDELLGRRPARLDRVGEVGRAEVTAYLRSIAADVLYVVDERAEPDLSTRGLPVAEIPPTTAAPLPPGEVFRPGMVMRMINRDARSSRVALTGSGLAHDLDGRILTLAWPDVAGVMCDTDGILVLFGLDGTVISVGESLYRNGRRLVEAVRAQVSPELFYDNPHPDDA